MSGTFRPAEPLSRTEVACGICTGRYPGVPTLPARGETPRDALESTVLPLLRRPPCLISFSGGLDSSALLALAARVARANGLPDPIPATTVFAGAPEADETQWQRLVLGHLEIDEGSWLRFPASDELDLVGEVSVSLMERHGLLWPYNLHLHQPIIEAAAGGSLMTGFGGDELGLSSAGRQAERMLAERRVRTPRDVAYLGYHLGPGGAKWLREWHRADAFLDETPWLTSRGRARVRRQVASDSVAPFGWARVLRSLLWRSRYVQVSRRNLTAVAEPYGVVVANPFVEAPLLQSLAVGRFAGLGSRERVWNHLFADLLPEDFLERKTKAVFDSPLWTDTAIGFARRWDGVGVDESLVDPGRLQANWLSEDRSVLSATLLQATWLRSHA